MPKLSEALVQVEVGYAVSAGGRGLAYASLSSAPHNLVFRLPFRIAQLCSPIERAAGYAALVTVARSLCKRGVKRARFVLPDGQLVDELSARRQLPYGLTLPYVSVRCALNALERFEIRFGETDELMQRARAEVALNLAA